ncbi:MAG: hypothetical protein JSW28_08975 [Thermoplasmata archaeon]|nr:MAG: hypothetical protein JSW28_08975 [Thermoplasmata archaeon]
MLAIVHLNWRGTNEEFQAVCKHVKEIIVNTQGIELVGLYVPSNDWNYAVVYKVKSFTNFLDYQKIVREKLRQENLNKIPKRELELYVEPKSIGQY